jgi:hypothetical protein
MKQRLLRLNLLLCAIVKLHRLRGINMEVKRGEVVVFSRFCHGFRAFEIAPMVFTLHAAGRLVKRMKGRKVSFFSSRR